MNNHADLECNIYDTFEKYCKLTGYQMEKAVKRALYEGAHQLQGLTKQSASEGMKTRNNRQWYNGHIITFNDKIEDAVMVSKYNDKEQSVKVHVMGSGRKGSGTYRFRFLEKGTIQDREAKTYKGKPLKKNRNLGGITGQLFFKQAQDEVFPLLPNIYMRSITETVNKINNTQI